MSRANEGPQEPQALDCARTALENPPQEHDLEPNKALLSLKREKLIALEKECQRRMAAWQKRQTRLK